MSEIHKYTKHIILAVLVAAMAFIVVWVYRNPNTSVAGFGYPSMFMITDYEKSALKDDEGGYTYTFRVPEGVANYGTLYLTFYIKHAYSRVTVEGSEAGPWEYVPRKEKPHIGRTPGNYWQSAPVPSGYASRTIRVDIIPVYGQPLNDPQFIITDRFMSMYMQMHYDRPVLILSIIVIISGIFQALVALLMPYEPRTRLRLFYLGALTAMTGLWKLMGLPLLSLLFSEHAQAYYYTGICAYFLIPVLIVQMLMYSYDRVNHIKHVLLFGITAGISGAGFILQLAGIVELHDMLIPVIVTGAAASWLSVYKRPVKGTDIIRWLIPAAFSADAAIFLVTGSADKSLVLLILMIAEIIVGGVMYIREWVRKDNEFKQARTQALVNQIRPHFIFNTMSSIYYLAQDKPDSVMPAIDHFSEYLQANFRAFALTQPISFEKEKENTIAYIAVEEILKGDRIKVIWDTPFNDFKLPALSLQPLVENAIKHAGSGNGVLTVTIMTQRSGEDAVVTVLDDGEGIAQEELDLNCNSGALHNISDRIRLTMGGSLYVRRRESGGTSAEMRIPLKTGHPA